MYNFDVVIIGTGTAGYTAAYQLVNAGKKTAIIDKQPYGGTCAIRGCQPKKYLVAAAETSERVKLMQGIGIKGKSEIDWPSLIASKEEFTSVVPERTKRGFEKAGIATLYGNAKFINEHEIEVGNKKISAGKFIIATGAKPMKLGIKGEKFVHISDEFMTMTTMPESIAFIGGGFISFEFAHVANQAGSKVTILHNDDKPLIRFEQELVKTLCNATDEAGIKVITDFPVNSVEKSDTGFKVYSDKSDEVVEVQAVFHGAGRAPDIEDLNLNVAGVNVERRGVKVDATMQTTNPDIYAIGDAAATIQLATLADMEADVAAQNILGNKKTANYSVIPSAVFSLPPLAMVGLTEEDVKKTYNNFRVNTGDSSKWPSSKRIGQKYSGYKVIIDNDTDLILGAHLLGYNSSEAINIFAMAMKFSITTTQLKEMLWSYPTYVSDLKYTI